MAKDRPKAEPKKPKADVKKPKGAKENPFAKGKAAKGGKCPDCGKDMKDCKC